MKAAQVPVVVGEGKQRCNVVGTAVRNSQFEARRMPRSPKEIGPAAEPPRLRKVLSKPKGILRRNPGA